MTIEEQIQQIKEELENKPKIKDEDVFIEYGWMYKLDMDKVSRKIYSIIYSCWAKNELYTNTLEYLQLVCEVTESCVLKHIKKLLNSKLIIKYKSKPHGYITRCAYTINENKLPDIAWVDKQF